MEQIITLISNISLTLTFLAGLIFGIAQVKPATRERRERLTVETLRAFQTREFAELMGFIRSNRFPKTSEEAEALKGLDFVMLLQFSQQMESVGILVADGLMDIDLVDKTLGNYVTTSWNQYKKFIISLREDDPYLSEYFQWLAEKMAERAAKNPRVPFYKNSSEVGAI